MGQLESLHGLLVRCTVRIVCGAGSGTGFFVAPRLILTCAHVIEPGRAGAEITAYWPPPSMGQTSSHTATLEAFLPRPYPDLALLRIEHIAHPCVYFDASDRTTPGNRLYCYGYPDDYPEGDSALPTYEGPATSGGPVLKLMGAQIRPGFSGAPLLDPGIGAVCGVVQISRGRASDLGGRGLPAAEILARLDQLKARHEQFHQSDTTWHICFAAQQRPDSLYERAKRLLLVGPPLPSVSTINPYLYLGVTGSDLAERYALAGQRPPYVRRDIDDQIDCALRTDRFIVIVGPSKAGKSRTAYEAIDRVFPHHKLLIPSTATRLRALLALDPSLDMSPGPAVLWLDDLEQYLEASALDLRTVTDWRQRQSDIVVVATMRANEHDRIRDRSGEVGRTARTLLAQAREIRLAENLSPGERAQAQHLYRGQRFRGSIGEHFVAAKELITRFEDGREACPEGVALVQAAIDWRRAGVFAPISETALKRLYRPYLRALRPTEAITANHYRRGLRWATKPVASSVALLTPTNAEDNQAFQVFDYVVEYVDRGATGGADSASAIPDATWNLIISDADPAVAFGVGFMAYTRGNKQAAQAAFRRATTSSDSNISLTAMGSLGVVLQEQGDLEGAKGAYQHIIDSGHFDQAPLAAFNLGVLLAEEGGFEGAQAAFCQAVASGHIEYAPMAGVNLGVVCAAQGKDDEAATAFQLAMDSGHPEQSPKAAFNLGQFHAERGQIAAATTTFQLAMASGHPTHSPVSAVNLGVLLADHDDIEGAKAAFRHAMAFRHPEQSLTAAVNLGLLLKKQELLEDAKIAFQQAIESNHPEMAPRAALNVGEILLKQGAIDGARAAYELVIVSGHAKYAPMAMLNRALLQKEQGEISEAKATLQQVIDAGHANYVSAAVYSLGVVHQEQGDVVEAKAAFQHVIASGHVDYAPASAVNLGGLLKDEGAIDQAKATYQLAIDSGHAKYASAAALNMGIILENEQDTTGAMTAYQQAMTFGDSQYASMAAERLLRIRLPPS